MAGVAPRLVLVLWAGCSFDPRGAAVEPPDAASPDAVRPDAEPPCASSYPEAFAGSRYRLGEGTWYEARSECEAEGGRLVVIDDAEENAFVLGLHPPGDIWIGMSDHLEEGTFRWLTGQVVMGGTYENWQEGQPNDSGSGEDCGEMNAGGVWNDNGCRFTQTYVCECGGAPAAEPPTWCETRTDTDCDVCGDDCTAEDESCSGSTCA